MKTMLKVSSVSKTFILHNQNDMRLSVLSDEHFSVGQGECVVLNGQSGSGKSTLLRALYANYKIDSGSIEVDHKGDWVDLASASEHEIIDVRRHTIGWVSQFLRTIPRISTLEVVMQPLLERGGEPQEAEAKAKQLLTRLNVPENLWDLAPATFSGGEQQRVNIARGFIVDYPVLLLDEPTASLDAANSAVVVSLVNEAKARGAAVIGIFHDERIQDSVADRLYNVVQTDNSASQEASGPVYIKTCNSVDSVIVTNVNLVLENEVIRGSLELRNGQIAAMSDSVSRHPGAVDGENGFLLPGLIEMHTDNLEQYFTPRPKVKWPPFSAMSAHDTQLIGSGITTVLDAVALGDFRDGSRSANLDQFIHTVMESQKRGVTRAEHRLHLRCEVPHESTLSFFERYVSLPLVQLVSVMDHAPGQRQFVDLEKYRIYYQGKYNMTDEEMRAYEQSQIEQSERWSAPNRREICCRCRELNIPMASHDDATVEHVLESKELGMVVAEFPTTEDAARKSHQLGLNVVMGAPNVVRGGSHSGNIAAHQLASLGVLDILSSDYFPASLLDSVFILAEDDRNTLNIAQSVRLATRNPAKALGLNDRGVIAERKRADLVLTHRVDRHQFVSGVWREGKKVF